MTEDDEPSDFADSGPFCLHWSDGDCEEVCARCGHRCGDHGMGMAVCSVDGCACEAFVDTP